MTDTVEVEVLTDFYDAGESVYRHAGESFETDDPDAYGDLVEAEATDDDSDDAAGLTDLDGVGDATADKLREADYETVEDVRSADAEAFAEVDGISADLADSLTSGE